MSESSPVESENAPSVVFVDDDANFLDVLSQQMEQRFSKKFHVRTCATMGIALMLMKAKPVDLVCLDVTMPVIDGIQALKLIRKQHPTVRTMMLTSHVNVSFRQEAFDNGVDFFIQKPRTWEEYDELFLSISAMLRQENSTGFKGIVQMTSLTDLIQMECTSHSSIVVDVKSGPHIGKIYIAEGEIIHAQCDTLVGFEAFKLLMAQKRGSFETKPYELPAQMTIDVRWDYLLLECARESDESSPIPPHPPFNGKTETVVVDPEKARKAAAEGNLRSMFKGVDEALCLSPNGDVEAAIHVTDPDRRRHLIDRVIVQSSIIGERIFVPELARVKSESLASMTVIRMNQSSPGEFERFEMEGETSRFVVLSKNAREVFAKAKTDGLDHIELDKLSQKLTVNASSKEAENKSPE
jgi:CheY-like chemotaxis protein